MSELSPTRVREWGPAAGLARILNGISAVMLFILMCLTCVDVFGRYLFNSPLTGSTELTEIALAIIVFACMPVITWRDEHIVVDMLDSLFGPTARRIRSAAIQLLIAGCLFFLGQRVWILGNRSLSYGEVSEYLEVPTGYVTLFIAIMCWFTAATVATYGVVRAFRQP